MIKKGVLDWNNQYTYTLPVNTVENEYTVSLSQFVSKTTANKITANDITAISFTWQNGKNTNANIGGSLSNIRFTTIDAANAQTVTSNDIGVYPNPNNGKFKVVFNADTDKPVALKLTDASTGRIIYTQFINAKKGTNTVEVNINQFFASDMYILSIEADDIRYQSKKVYMQKLK